MGENKNNYCSVRWTCVPGQVDVCPCQSLIETKENRFHPFKCNNSLGRRRGRISYRPHLLASGQSNHSRRSPSPQPFTGPHISILHPEIVAYIFSYLKVEDKGKAAQVCTAWRDVCYQKSVWKGVEAKLHLRGETPSFQHHLRRETSPFQSLVCRGITRIQVLSLRRSLRDVTLGIRNLISLNLSGCYNVKDDALLQAFTFDIPTLLHLNLSLCKQITDRSLIRLIQVVKNLESFELGGCCNVTDASLFAISVGLPKLKRLNLRSCWHISDYGISLIAGQIEHFSSSSSADASSDVGAGNSLLEYLGLQDCQHLSDEALKFISLGLESLKSINLSFCIGITDNGLKYLAKLPSLKELNLHSCDNISDTGMAYMAEGGSFISSLDISFCDKVTDQSLIYISQGLFNIKSLSVNACNISDEGIGKIAKTLLEIRVLNIGQCCHVTDSSLLIIADSFKNLCRIDLYGCSNITTAGLDRILAMPKLSTLNLGLWHIR